MQRGLIHMNGTMELRKFVAPEVITGNDARLLVGRYILHFGSKKPMVVTDKDLFLFSWFQDVLKEVEIYAPDYCIFDQVTPNPKDYEVMQGAKKFNFEKCDLIIAIGGGSPIDCAKGISIVSANGGHILDYEGVDEINLPGSPLICIPTTAGASADVSQFAIICDSANKIKKAIISKKVVPDIALLDAIPLMTMDPYLTACTGMDALTHAIEAYVSNANSPLANVHALESIELIHIYLQEAVKKDRGVEVLYQMMLGSLHAGLAFSNASLGLVHAMSHSMGGMFDLPHGECNSMLLEHVIELNFDGACERYTTIAEKMCIDINHMDTRQIKAALLRKIHKMKTDLEIRDFKEIGNMNDSIYDKLVEETLEDPCLVTNPIPVTKEEIESIFRKVIHTKVGKYS